ncbi:MAG: GAF and HD-GYP domain-containing protein [Solirubrobacteraceae bacterium]
MPATQDTGDRKVEDAKRLDSLSTVARNPSIENSLLAICELLAMDLAYATEVTGEEQVFRWMQGDAASFGVAEGDRIAIAETYCKRVLAGEMPALIPNVALDPVASALAITAAAGIGAFISVPMRRADGTLYGTLCAASHLPQVGLTPRDLTFLEVFARLICDEIEREDSERARQRLEVTGASMGALLAAMGARDAYTGAHTRAVVDLARRVGLRYGLSEPELDDVAAVALLHDIGKVGIPDAVLLKPESLDSQEWRVMREHSAIGAAILASVPGLTHLTNAVRAEHERWDGTGYPDGLDGETIPVASRIVLACDAYHAMTSDRPYRAACTPVAAIAELRRNAGGQFDPRAVDALLAVLAAA